MHCNFYWWFFLQFSPKAAFQLITSPCDPEYVAEFLWKHMQRDLNVLGRALGRSVDDAALAVHLVLHQMISLDGGQTGKMYCILMMRIVSVCYAFRIFLLDDKEYYNNSYRAKTRSFRSSKLFFPKLKLKKRRKSSLFAIFIFLSGLRE